MAGEQLARRHGPPPARAAHARLALEQHEQGGQLGRRIGVGDAADHGPARADRRVGDVGQHLGQQRQPLGHERGALGRAQPHQRAEGQRAVVEHGLGRLVLQEVEVDQVRRRRQAHVEDRDQALPAGQHLRLRAELREQVVDLLAGARAVVGEGRGLHGPAVDLRGSGDAASGSASASPNAPAGGGTSGWNRRSTW